MIKLICSKGISVLWGCGPVHPLTTEIMSIIT